MSESFSPRGLPAAAERPVAVERALPSVEGRVCVCRYQLAAIVAGQGLLPSGSRQRERLLLLAATALPPGSAIEICYTLGDRPGVPVLLEVLGYAPAGSGWAAKVAAEIETALRSNASPLLFRRVDPGIARAPALPCAAQLQRPGLLIPLAAAGGSRPAHLQLVGDPSSAVDAPGFAGASIVVPRPVPSQSIGFSIDDFLNQLASHPDAVVLSVMLEPQRLAAHDLRLLRDALARLTYGGALVHAERVELRTDDEDRRLASAFLAHWLDDGEGIRLACEISSTAPLPRALLQLAGSAIHGAAGGQARTTGATLDLRHWLPVSGQPNPLFASAALLTALGLPERFPVPNIDLPTEGRLLGRLADGREVRQGRDAKARHAYLIGQTGTGKSTLLCNLLHADIVAGHGVTLVDPHGDLTEQVLGLVPDERLDDVVLIDPGDGEAAVGINFLELPADDRDLAMGFVVNEMIRIFERLYDMRVAGGPMFESFMRYTLLLLMEASPEPPTLCDVSRLFEEPAYRRFLLARCSNPVVTGFWQGQVEKVTGDHRLENMAPYITSKLNQFTGNPRLRAIIGQRQSTVDFGQFLDEGRIVLINLAKGTLGELDCRLLGMLLVGKLFLAALGRGRQPIGQRRLHRVYIDEFQNFVTDTLGTMLSESRKYGIELTCANQTLGQLTDRSTDVDLANAVLANCSDLMAMRVGVPDAMRLADWFVPAFTPRQLAALPDHHVAARLMSRGRPLPPFAFETLPAPVPAPGRHERVQAITECSRRLYARPRGAGQTSATKRNDQHPARETPDPALLREQRRALAARIGMRGSPASN